MTDRRTGDVTRPFDEALLDTRSPAEFAVAPDGRTVAFALQSTVDDVGRHFPSEIWFGRLDRAPERLAEGRTPAWSPDGSQLAFLSDRITPGHNLPYTIEVSEEGTPVVEPRLAATLHGSAESVGWSGDGGRLLVQAADPGSYALDWSARAVTGADGSPPRIRRPQDAWRRLFLVDLATARVSEVGPAGLSVWEFDWDGVTNPMALVSEDPTGNGWYGARLAALDLERRTATTVYLGRRSLEGVVLSPDGRHVAVVEGYSSDPGLLTGSATIIDVATGTSRDPWPGLETVGRLTWAGPEHLWFTRYAGTHTAIGELWLDGRREERWEGDAFIGPDLTKPSCEVLEDGSVFSTHQGHGRPPEIATFDSVNGDWSRLTGFIRQPADAETRLVGDSLLHAPVDAGHDVAKIDPARIAKELLGEGVAASRATAGVRLEHRVARIREQDGIRLGVGEIGIPVPGRTAVDGHDHGPRAAAGRRGDEPGLDLDAVVRGGPADVADPGKCPAFDDRVVGGYMAGWAVTQTDRFKAAVAISVVAEFRSFHLTSEVAAWAQSILRADWNDIGGPYDERSPVTHAANAITPTLVIAGELDRCTPVSQGELLFGALAEAGCETELVILPGEGHVPVSRRYALEAIRRTQAWFDRYLRSGT